MPKTIDDASDIILAPVSFINPSAKFACRFGEMLHTKDAQTPFINRMPMFDMELIAALRRRGQMTAEAVRDSDAEAISATTAVAAFDSW